MASIKNSPKGGKRRATGKNAGRKVVAIDRGHKTDYMTVDNKGNVKNRLTEEQAKKFGIDRRVKAGPDEAVEKVKVMDEVRKKKGKK